MNEIMSNRAFLKCPDMSAMRETETDQKLGLPVPPFGKVVGGERIELPPFDDALVVHPAYMDLLDLRRSERVYTDTPATQKQLAMMLWTSQGVQDLRGESRSATLRPVPSGGARHPFEVYIVVMNVEGLKQGLYHYLPMEHVGEKLCTIEYLKPLEDAEALLGTMLVGQKWAVKAGFVLFFTCIPYRAEWRYKQTAHRVILIDLGHVGQNVMLSATALGLGSCCLAAYDAAKCDEVFGVDGVEEYTVYAIPVGVLKKS